MEQPLLYELFLAVQRYDRKCGHKALGLESYWALLEALEKGVGFNSEDQLKWLCTALWRKPHHDPTDFEMVLDKALKLFYLEKEKEAETPGLAPLKSKGGIKKEKTGAAATGSTATTEADKKDQEDRKGEKSESKEDTVIISFENARPARAGEEERAAIREVEKEMIYSRSYILSGNYFELSSRKLQQRIRAMRRLVKSRKKQEVDLEATIEKVSRQGFLEGLEYKGGNERHTDLIILIDHGPSMAAFEEFADMLIAVTDEDYQFEKTIYYFSSAPVSYLFLDKEHHRALPLPELAKTASSPVLIFSDAGAATGKIDRERISATVDFLRLMKGHKVAWLNPMPRHRWKGTSADFISFYVAMFDANLMEIGNVIKLFKAKLRLETLL